MELDANLEQLRINLHRVHMSRPFCEGDRDIRPGASANDEHVIQVIAPGALVGNEVLLVLLTTDVHGDG